MINISKQLKAIPATSEYMSTNVRHYGSGVPVATTTSVSRAKPTSLEIDDFEPYSSGQYH